MRGYISRTEINAQIDKLISLRQMSDPSGGEATEDDKGGNARMAIRNASAAIDALVEWAVHHEIGVALTELSDGRAGPQRRNGESIMPARMYPTNSHRYEELGRAYRSQDYTPQENRHIAAKLLGLGLPAFPMLLANELSYSLKALAFGETARLLEKASPGLVGNARSLAMMRLRAIKHVEYRYASGARKGKTQKAVAEVFGITLSAIRKWPTRDVPNVLGQDVVNEEIRIAKARGNLRKQINRELEVGVRDTSDAVLVLHESFYGDPQLKLDGDAYKAIQHGETIWSTER